MSKVIVTHENVKPGDKVVRGKDWMWADQDKGSEYGVIQKNPHLAPKWIWVIWEGQSDVRGYRVGGQNSFDLYFYDGLESKNLDGRPKLKLDG